MTLTHDDIADIALLARIGITDEEKKQYCEELSSVVEYFAQLQEVDTTNVEDVGHSTGVTDVVRDDVAVEASEEERAAMMAQVPHVRDGHIAVKNML